MAIGPAGRSAHRLHRFAVSELAVLEHPETVPLGQPKPRCLPSGIMPDMDKALRFVLGNPVFDPISIPRSKFSRIFGEPLRAVRIQPAAFLIQGIGIIPVEQGQKRFDPVSIEPSINRS